MLKIPVLPAFEKSDWDAVTAAFAGAPSLTLSQPWLPVPQDRFRSGEVRIGWRPGALWIRALLDDECVICRATADNQYMWDMGDTFEMFVRAADGEEYFELHATPSGHRLQLAFASDQTIRQLRDQEIKLEDLVVAKPLFRFAARTLAGGWEVLAEIPASTLRWPDEGMAGREILLSFGRFDAAADGSTPVMSCSSPHRELNFHLQQDWSRAVLTE